MKHLLVIRLSAMGDVAMTVPVIKALTEQNPHLKITFLSKAFLKPLFDDLSNVTFCTAKTEHEHKGVLGLYKLYKELKKEKIDGVADLHNVLRSKILILFFKFSKIKTITIDKGRCEKKALTNSRKKKFKQLRSTHERYADVFRKIIGPLDLSTPTFSSPIKLSHKIQSIFEHSDKKTKLVGIAPFAQYRSKTYPIDLMEQVIKQVSERENLKVLLFGGGTKEIEILNKLEEKFKRVFCIAGKLTLKEELSLISNLSCMLSMDSGNGHFSAIYGVPTITLWGVTHPYAGFSPFHQPKENAIIPDLKKYPKIPCSVYGKKVFPGYEYVMKSISPKVVTQAILSVL